MHKNRRLRVINGAAGAPPAAAAAPAKFWNLANVGQDDAELTLYGEIVSRRPVDWWTGEPLEGLFVSPEEFLTDLAVIKDKSAITIRINSIGGDLYTALGIYTQLKSLTGTKTVIIDGIAASAATIIAMAGDVVKIPTGGLFMIHEALMDLWGIYNHKALLEVNKRLEAANKSAAETYATKTKLDTEAIRALMAKETWMTGREAVDKGFADEVMYDSEPQMSMSADRSLLVVNGITQPLVGLRNVPGNIPVSRSISATAAPQAEINTTQGGKPKVKTIEELKTAYPKLVAQIESAAMSAAKTEGEQAERSRIKAIEDIQAAIGDDKLLADAKYGEKPCTAEQLAFLAMQKQAALGKTHLDNVAKDFAASGAGAVGAEPNAGMKPDGAQGDDKAAEAQAAAMIAGHNTKKEAQ